jgi:cell division protein FtsZ
MMGTGEADGERRALDAAEAAIANPLLDDISMKGARGVLINITGGTDITLFEVDEAASRIRAEVDQDAYIIIGSAFDNELQGTMRVSVVATGIDAIARSIPQPTMLRVTEVTPRPELIKAEPELGLSETENVSEISENKPLKGEDAISETISPLARLVLEAQTESKSKKEKTEALKPVSEPVRADIDERNAPEPAVEDLRGAPQIANVPLPATPSSEASEFFIPPEPKALDSTEQLLVDSGLYETTAMPEEQAVSVEGEGPNSEIHDDIRPSLFERVTRTGRAAINRVVPEAPLEPSVGAVEVIENKGLKDLNTAESLAVSHTVPTAKKAFAEAVMEDVAELESFGTENVEEEDDELLDIPAFLRRQAN